MSDTTTVLVVDKIRLNRLQETSRLIRMDENIPSWVEKEDLADRASDGAMA